MSLVCRAGRRLSVVQVARKKSAEDSVMRWQERCHMGFTVSG